ncbi:MAG: WYL domain-containing protein, partial [Clostridiales bacterium]|nr:WYL domain-containing protein [Clostridiales bacterium]
MKRPNQKLKLLYLMKILMQETDEAHPLSLAQLVEKLEGYGVEAERKSLYDDMEVLRVFGIDIEKTGSRNCVYYVGSRTFEVAELKLLVDAVQASKFITRKKSSDLIKKMESLASVYEAGTLQRQVYVGNRVKTMNESIYYNVDKLHTAIYDDKKISFRYTDWAVDFTAGARVKRQVRKNGRRYAVSPWALTWNNENYYLVGFDAAAGRI